MSLFLAALVFLLVNVIAYNYTRRVVYPVVSAETPKPVLTHWEKITAFFTGIAIYKSKITEWPSTSYSTIRLTTKDGYIIEGWWLPPGSGSRKTVILFPGIRNSKSTLLYEADFFQKLGYNCLLVDLRANGGSTGEKCSFGMDEAEDVYLAYQYVRSLYSREEIVLWGESMGAVAILRSVALYHIQPDKLVLEKPFDHFREAVKNSIDYFSAASLPSGMLSYLCTFWISWHTRHWAYNHIASVYAAAVDCPVLIQAGALDQVAGERQADNIYRALRPGKKRMEVYPASGHRMALCISEPVHWENTIAGFLK